MFEKAAVGDAPRVT